MNKIVNVQVGSSGKVYCFDPGHFVLKKGVKVLVETEHGLVLGVVCSEPKNLGDDVLLKPPKKITRLASEKDIDRYEKGCRTEQEANSFCLERIKARSLPMNLVGVEGLLDGSKIIVYFSAEGRVDFRELVKDLVQKFHTRIEMRQIGVRHQAKMVGGLGNCGRQLCCTSFLNRFDPVSIKMAKEQNLSLNPSKISGMCGRLMCCLTYEHPYYEQAKRGLPKLGKKVNTAYGEGKVTRQNILRKTLTVLLASGEEKEIPYDGIVKETVKT